MKLVFLLAFILMCAAFVAVLDRLYLFHVNKWRGSWAFASRTLLVVVAVIAAAAASTTPHAWMAWLIMSITGILLMMWTGRDMRPHD